MNGPAPARTDPRAWLQELKASRRTQVALLACVLLVPLLLYVALSPDAPHSKRTVEKRQSFSEVQALASHQLQLLESLPKLSKLGQAGELPDEERVYRDLFLFDAPAPPVQPKKEVVQPPKQLTAEEIEAERLRQAREAEMGARPRELRYLGYLESPSSGRLGAFMKGEEPVILKLGTQPNPKWKLVQVMDKYAEFQDLAFPDLKFRLEAKDAGSTPIRTTTNEY